MTDVRVANYVLGRPDRERVGKEMLKDAMYGLLPQQILNRKDKRGFPVPYVEWAQGPLRDFVGESQKPVAKSESPGVNVGNVPG